MHRAKVVLRQSASGGSWAAEVHDVDGRELIGLSECGLSAADALLDLADSLRGLAGQAEQMAKG